jgi:hypothetical protein
MEWETLLLLDEVVRLARSGEMLQAPHVRALFPALREL